MNISDPKSPTKPRWRNPFFDFTLRAKLTVSFILFGLLAGFISFLIVQRALQPIIDDTVPTIYEVGRMSLLTAEVQLESASFLADGDAEHLENLNLKATEIESLAAQFATDLADDPEEVEAFTRYAEIARQLSTTAQSTAQSHRVTLETVSTLEELGGEAQTVYAKAQEIVNAEINRNIQAGDLDELNTDALPTKKLVDDLITELYKLQVEAGQYIYLNEGTTLDEIDEIEARIEGIQQELNLVLEAGEANESDLAVDLNDIQEKIQTTARQEVNSHTQTLANMEQLDILAKEFGTAGAQVDQSVAEEIEATTADALTNSSLISLAVSILAAFLGYGLASLIAMPIRQLVTAANQITAGNLEIRVEVNSKDEVGNLAISFNTMTSRLREFITTLEQRVAARTQDLAIVAEVGTATATILETDKLLQAVVDLTKERFNLYHSHIYLLDEAAENLVLASGAGEIGRQMVAEKRSIPLDREQSLVARAARERKGVTVNDVTRSADFLSNPLLPNTRSELAVPMIVGGKVIGVFDIQSDVIGRFTDSDINIQTTLASQVATSIQNVRSFEQSKAQAELETLVNSIGQKIQHTTTVEDTLQTAIREIGLALGASRVSANIQSNRQLELNKESVE
jgi:putative methionine-R-sulfoxide reductase with GAF domain